MQRLVLFALLVVVIPFGAFLAGRRETTLPDFLLQVKALKGRSPSAPPSEVTKKPAEVQEPKEEPPAPDQEPPAPAAPDPREAAEKLYLSGRFSDAAAAFAEVDPGCEAEARFALALERAFPVALPNLPYMVVQSAEGFDYEGFAEERGGDLVLMAPAGATISLPLDRIRTRRTVPRDEFLAAARKEAVADSDIDGKQIFFLLRRAFAIGDREGAARLVRRALDRDEREVFLLSAFQSRIEDVQVRADVFRAYSACQRTPEPVIELPVAPTPTKIGGGKPPGAKPPKPIVKDPKAVPLMGKAKPLREKAYGIYERVAMNALTDKTAPGDLAEVEEALRLYHEADALYSTVLEIEPDNSAVASIAKDVSKKVAMLEMLKIQLTTGRR